MEHKYLFFIFAYLAEIIGTISGFGSSILFVPLASIFFDFKIVLGITAIFHVFSNLSKIALFRKGIDKRIILKLGIPAVLFVTLGALLTRYIPEKEIEVAMSIVLVLLSIYLILQFNKPVQSNDRNLILGGVASGFLAGLIGTGGAIRGITLAAFQLPKDIFIATSAMIDLGVDSSRAIIYVWNGYFLTEHLILIPGLIVVSILGTYTGKRILHFTSERVFRYLVLGIILLASSYQISHYFFMG